MVCYHTISDFLLVMMLGLNAGQMLGVNLITMKVIMLINNTRERVLAWRNFYEIAKNVVVFITMLTTILIVPSLFDTFDFTKFLILLLSVSKLPITYGIIKRVNDQLFNDKIAEEKSIPLMRAWIKLHWVRVINETIAFALGLYIVITSTSGHDHSHDHDHSYAHAHAHDHSHDHAHHYHSH